ncbi:MAG: L,D-transpeptidase [Gemmatimonadaceae bacterium]|jgi:hypothetical protein|nr:L,D-transpeptidase [Gemmatimonadaceae bacterium]
MTSFRTTGRTTTIAILLSGMAFVVAGRPIDAQRPAHRGPVATRAIAAARPTAVRMVVSLSDRKLWVLRGRDTVRTAPVAVASGDSLRYGGRAWRFQLPRGRYQVRAKRADPQWRPPDWHYAEVAREHGLRLRALPPGGHRLRDGRRLIVKDSVVALVPRRGGAAQPLPVDEHIVFDQTLFIPPLSAKNRHLDGALGAFALDLGNGYLVHGATDSSSIGAAVTHGCLRVGDDDLEWLYGHIDVGTQVHVR